MGFELITVRYSGIVLTYLGFRKSVHCPLMSKDGGDRDDDDDDDDDDEL